MFKVIYVSLFVFLSVTGSSGSVAKPWKVDHAESSIEFSGTHAGKKFVGSFSDWTADIVFDLSDLPKARVKANILTSSAATGSSLYDGTLKGEDWFNTERYADAVFEMASVTELSDGSYHMKGQLSLKDKIVALEAPFKLAIDGNRAKATMEFTIDRMQLGLGVKSDASASWVSQEIDLKVVISAQQ